MNCMWGEHSVQAPAVVAAYGQWCEDLQVEAQGQWVLVTGRRKG